MKSLPYHDRASLPRQPGLYFVYAGSNPFTRRLLYVGKAENLRKRHASHEKASLFKANGATHLEYRPVSLWRLKHEEAIAIRRYNPPLNKRKEKPNALISRWESFQQYVAIVVLISAIWYGLPTLANLLTSR